MSRAIIPQIRVPEDGLGPAMLALPQSMRAYVVARVFHGLNRSKAAKAAGYSADDPDVAKTQGYRLEHNEGIQAAIAEESRKLMRAEGPNSIRTLIEIRDNKKNEPKDRARAAIEILNRCGLGAVSESHVTVTHQMSEEQLDRRILELARELGLPEVEARKMLVAPDRVIEGEFEEVKPPPTPEEQRLKERRTQLRHASPEERERLKREALAKSSAEKKARYAAAQAFPDLSDIFG